MVMGVTILLSLTVFCLLASTHIPETSEVPPSIGRYGIMGRSMEIKKKIINLLFFAIFDFSLFITEPAHERLSKLMYTRN